jgi:hypothetical protein
MGLGAFLADRAGVLGRGKEQWAVVAALALVAPDELEKEEHTRSIQPRLRLNPRTVNFMIAAPRTAFPPNSEHNDKYLYSSSFFFVLLLFWAWRLQQNRCFLTAAAGMACHELFCLLQEKLAERTHFGVRVYAERFHCSSMASCGASFPSLCCCCCRRSNSKKSAAS